MPPALPGGCQGQTAVARKGRGLLNRADARSRQLQQEKEEELPIRTDARGGQPRAGRGKGRRRPG